jgi:hypothetical protein
MSIPTQVMHHDGEIEFKVIFPTRCPTLVGLLVNVCISQTRLLQDEPLAIGKIILKVILDKDHIF